MPETLFIVIRWRDKLAPDPTRSPFMKCRRCTLYLLTILVFGGALLSACGRKGPLYLPDRPAPHKAAANSAAFR